ncbi:glycosyltransferase [Mycobacterium numidiamassiliense]
MAGYGGSRGDVEPLAALGRELVRRGHEARLGVDPMMVDFVESIGLEAVSNLPELWAMGDGGLQLMERSRRAMIGWAETLSTLADGADLLLVLPYLERTGANVAEHYGIPMVTLHFFPAADARPDGLTEHIMNEAEDAQRRALGLPEVHQTSTRRASLELHAYDVFPFPEFAAERAKDDSRRSVVGALTLQLPTDADEDVLSWIARGTPPIYFGFGSMEVPSPAETVAVISAACARLGERGLVCLGPNHATDIPHFDHVKVASSVNHSVIFPACRAIVHHGGAGTTAAGMRAGIPALILWFSAEDQPIWADVVTRLKVGSGRAFSDSTLDSLTDDLRSVLTPQCASRAREVAAAMSDPAANVSHTTDLLEQAARVRRDSSSR